MPEKQKVRLPANTHCLNCGEKLDSYFCPECGQKNKEYRLTFRDLFSEFFEELLDIDSRVLRSLRMLFTRPGFLTSEYTKGRRISYLPPVRIYLVASVLFFLLLSLKSLIPEIQSNELIRGFSESGDLETTLEQAVESRINPSVQDSAPDPAASGQVLSADTTGSGMTFSVGNDSFDLEQNDVMTGFQDNFAKVMFLLLPVAALLLKALYVRRKKMYIEHFIFSLHVHAFIFSLLILTVILDYKVTMWAVIVASLIYLYLALRNYYGQTYMKTAVKMLLLLLSYGFSIMLVMVLTLLVTAVGLLMGSA
ncbi:MAG: DUF3667 domain-containing protein [Candidatus Marinimicrobia bacterium]|nr:DUF3667 domain-containing protein [Candidatus Neomarinimicrobiota bacterium]MCF7851112.1 DUF3667 domain-containing protein [Candidatus Neomarinimicrobiota bacterium]MCF7904340.1 DUF3667 domain-containing protein [Candidatus Neomarinimicrobiota bacterium]